MSFTNLPSWRKNKMEHLNENKIVSCLENQVFESDLAVNENLNEPSINSARDVRYVTRGTGGGAAEKSLTDLDERFLALLSHLTVEGEDLPEAGVATSQDLNIEKIPIYFEDESQEV
ncbi:hypothetical protein FQR65_LT14182 [Abscondita terminalis]|nr:hypothetical protein FQR65_LT14182 [Abscondita terminalis]